jgi:antitoxin VapB
MALNIKNPEVDALARRLAGTTGESITNAVLQALRERLQREEGRGRVRSLKEELLEIADHCASLPDFDTRSPDEIIGYDEHGIPR